MFFSEKQVRNLGEHESHNICSSILTGYKRQLKNTDPRGVEFVSKQNPGVTWERLFAQVSSRCFWAWLCSTQGASGKLPVFKGLSIKGDRKVTNKQLCNILFGSMTF